MFHNIWFWVIAVLVAIALLILIFIISRINRIGNLMQPGSKEKVRFCPKCHSMIWEKTQLCPKCGAQIQLTKVRNTKKTKKTR
jgi:uncharacterized paraquat-inducible protein A